MIEIRPEKIRISRSTDSAPGDNSVSGILRDVEYFGGMSIYKVKLDSAGTMRIASINVSRVEKPVANKGERVTLTWSADAGTVLAQ